VALRGAWPPDAIYFGALRGGKPLRYIYLDEAGSSANEPATVVAGIVIDADAQYVLAERRVDQLLESVPHQHRSGSRFVPHAKAIFHGERGLREGWNFAERRTFINQLIAIAPALGIPVVVGVARKSIPMAEQYKALGMTPADYRHMWAFSLCAGEADRYIVQDGGPMEVATLVVENIPERERFLNAAFESIKRQPISLQMDHGSEIVEKEAVQVNYTICRIRDNPHFVAKRQNSLLWIADACAFAYARWLSGGSYGAELVAPIKVPPLEAAWKDPMRLFASAVVGARRKPLEQKRA
jgi:hypothetical protein